MRVLIDWVRDERGAELKDNNARHLRVRGTGDARAPFFTDQDEKRLLYELSQMSNKNHLRLTKSSETHKACTGNWLPPLRTSEPNLEKYRSQKKNNLYISKELCRHR